LTHSATVKLALTAIFFGGSLGRMEDAERNNDASRQTESLQRAISLVGGGTRLARALGVTKQAVSAWRRPPALHVAEISRLSGIDPHQLRPDIFPRPKTDEVTESSE
jgi:DNA-binding transcriptional regulator YdaS (Cro superfamily)